MTETTYCLLLAPRTHPVFTPQMNPRYNNSLPVTRKRPETHGLLLLQLWRPRQQLRSTLNTKLLDIVRDIRAEQKMYENFMNNKCQHVCVEINKNATVQNDIYKNDKCQNTFVLPSNTRVNNICLFPPPKLKLSVTDEGIMNLKNYGTVDIGLVCVHIRVGNTINRPGGAGKNNDNSEKNLPRTNLNGTFPDTQSFTDISKVPAMWEFLRPYVKRGHHVYLATDTQEVSE